MAQIRAMVLPEAMMKDHIVSDTAYPQLSEDGLSAALSYAARAMRSEVVWEGKVSA